MASGLLDKANIILTPTGYKAGTMYNVAPIEQPYEDFVFSRASVASRVNSSGLVEMVGRTLGSNLVQNGDFSEIGSELVTNGDFATDSNWSGTGSNGISISDGKLNFNNTPYTANSAQSNVTTVGKTYKVVFTVSDYVKGSVRIFLGGSATSTASANDTYAFYLTASSNTTIGVQVMGGSGTTLSVDNVSVKEIIDTNNIPRISYDSNGENGHILLEPTSTNLITYSEDFSSYTKSSIDLNDSLVSSPNGSNSATGLTNTTTAQCHIRTSFTTSSTGNYTGTIYIKRQDFDYIYVELGNAYARFDILNGTKGASGQFGTGWTYVNHDIETLSNGWFRISITANNTITGTYNFRPYQPTSTFSNYDSGSLGTSFIWGCQVENLSYATSYIPTLTGSTETRATETATGAGSAELINSTEGVLYAEIAALADDLTSRYISLNQNTSERVVIRYNTVSNQIQAFSTVGGSTQSNITYTLPNPTSFIKAAFKYKVNDFALWINGVEVGTDTSGSVSTFNTLDKLSFDQGNGAFPFYGKCKALAVFNEALSDDELNNLTG